MKNTSYKRILQKISIHCARRKMVAGVCVLYVMFSINIKPIKEKVSLLTQE
jgi:hypothetical protein